MALCWAVVNQKGGVGKTTTAVNLAAYIAAAGKRTLLIDADPQGNATSGLGVDRRSVVGDTYTVLAHGQSIADVKIVTLVRGLDLLPGTIDLAGAEMELFQTEGREYALKRALEAVKDDYDYVLIDAPPSLGLITVNALTAADQVLIPLQCEYYALEGISQLLEIIERVRKGLNPDLSVGRVILTLFDGRINLANQVMQEVKSFFGDAVSPTVVPRNVRLSEAPSFGKPISEYDPRSKGAIAYEQIAKELIDSVEQHKARTGRGLADLIPVVGGNEEPADKGTVSLEATRDAPIATIHANPTQPRTRFDEAALAELAESVRANGILQPILVRPRKAGGYEIVAGERRYRAALRAGLKSVPVVVRDLSDADTLALALIENLIREDIGPLESARAFQRLMADFGWTQEEMGQRVGKSRSAVANSLRLLSLPHEIQASVERGELSEGHARTLIGDERHRAAPDFAEHQLAIWREIVAKGLSVREVERRMRPDAGTPERGERGVGAKSGSPRSVASERRDALAERADFTALEDRLRDALGTQVRLVGTMERGRLEIEYFSAGELDDLMGKVEGKSSA